MEVGIEDAGVVGAPFVTGGANLLFPSRGNSSLPGSRPGDEGPGSGENSVEFAGSAGNGKVCFGSVKGLEVLFLLPNSALTAGFEGAHSAVLDRGCVIS